MSARPELPMARLDHVGIPTAEEKPGAEYLPDDGVWITNPRSHALGVEWVRHTADSRMPERLQREPHLAFRVDALAPYLAAHEVLVPPFDLGRVEIAFVDVDGVIVELIDFKETDEEEWVA